MTRFDPVSEAGWIDWPSEGAAWTDSGEGGLIVLAVWDNPDSDVMVCTPEYQVKLTADRFVGAVNLDGRSVADELWDGSVQGELSVGGVVPIGSTGASWMDPQQVGRYFTAAWDDVTETGRLVLNQLTKLYGEEPVLVTVLDT